MPAHERVKKAMEHAGPSITITSLTNALAFAFGGLNSLTALRSFCVFAAVCIVMLYLIVMTFFLAVVVWDTERVGRHKGECCGLCCCGMDNPICCKGFWLSNKQKRYGDVPVNKEGAVTGNKDHAQESEGEDDQESSKTEKCLEKYLAPNLLTMPGRIGILVIYVFLIAGSIYGCT